MNPWDGAFHELLMRHEATDRETQNPPLGGGFCWDATKRTRTSTGQLPRVIACRNDRRAQIANGSRVTVTETDAERRSLAVRFDDAREVQIDARYLDVGDLDYGYAMTAHRAQGTHR
jgi:ATP-dependent exoDNAse (exonuclease V) alpha subunit